MLTLKASTKMAIKQTIEYNSNNRYFAGFVQDLIDESGVKASVSQKDKKIVLLLDESDAKALERFGEYTNRYLPHSMFLGNIDSVIDEAKIDSEKFTSPAYNISLCPRCLEKLSDPSSAHYLDDTLKCDHYSNRDINEALDVTSFSPHYSEGDTLLVVDPESIDTLFAMTPEEKRALFSIEKPTIKVTLIDETLQELTSKRFINIKSPYSLRSTLVALNAKESEVPYLFFAENNDLKVSVVKDNIIIIRDNRGIGEPLEEFDSKTDINRFLNISKEAGFNSNSIGASLSVKNGISFMVSNEMGVKKVLKFQPFVLSDVLEQMRNDTLKGKLLVNFEKEYPSIIEELNSNGSYDLYETLCAVLELKERGFEALSDKSFEFRGNGGLKIDTDFSEDGFDYASFVGSVMSFKLAGTDGHYLAYSIFEAFGDMGISVLNQLKSKFKIENFVMMGSMFENTVLYSRIISKFQLSNPYFSKVFALDD